MESKGFSPFNSFKIADYLDSSQIRKFVRNLSEIIFSTLEAFLEKST
jgi:hypothetical protein